MSSQFSNNRNLYFIQNEHIKNPTLSRRGTSSVTKRRHIFGQPRVLIHLLLTPKNYSTSHQFNDPPKLLRLPRGQGTILSPLLIHKEIRRDTLQFINPVQKRQRPLSNGKEPPIVQVDALAGSTDPALEQSLERAMQAELERALPDVLRKFDRQPVSNDMDEGLRKELEQALVEEISRHLGDAIDDDGISDDDLGRAIEEGFNELDKSASTKTVTFPPLRETTPRTVLEDYDENIFSVPDSAATEKNHLTTQSIKLSTTTPTRPTRRPTVRFTMTSSTTTTTSTTTPTTTTTTTTSTTPSETTQTTRRRTMTWTPATRFTIPPTSARTVQTIRTKNPNKWTVKKHPITISTTESTTTTTTTTTATRRTTTTSPTSTTARTRWTWPTRRTTSIMQTIRTSKWWTWPTQSATRPTASIDRWSTIPTAAITTTQRQQPSWFSTKPATTQTTTRHRTWPTRTTTSTVSTTTQTTTTTTTSIATITTATPAPETQTTQLMERTSTHSIHLTTRKTRPTIRWETRVPPTMPSSPVVWVETTTHSPKTFSTSTTGEAYSERPTAEATPPIHIFHPITSTASTSASIQSQTSAHNEDFGVESTQAPAAQPPSTSTTQTTHKWTLTTSELQITDLPTKQTPRAHDSTEIFVQSTHLPPVHIDWNPQDFHGKDNNIPESTKTEATTTPFSIITFEPSEPKTESTTTTSTTPEMFEPEDYDSEEDETPTNFVTVIGYKYPITTVIPTTLITEVQEQPQEITETIKAVATPAGQIVPSTRLSTETLVTETTTTASTTTTTMTTTSTIRESTSASIPDVITTTTTTTTTPITTNSTLETTTSATTITTPPEIIELTTESGQISPIITESTRVNTPTTKLELITVTAASTIPIIETTTKETFTTTQTPIIDKINSEISTTAGTITTSSGTTVSSTITTAFSIPDEDFIETFTTQPDRNESDNTDFSDEILTSNEDASTPRDEEASTSSIAATTAARVETTSVARYPQWRSKTPVNLTASTRKTVYLTFKTRPPQRPSVTSSTTYNTIANPAIESGEIAGDNNIPQKERPTYQEPTYPPSSTQASTAYPPYSTEEIYSQASNPTQSTTVIPENVNTPQAKPADFVPLPKGKCPTPNAAQPKSKADIVLMIDSSSSFNADKFKSAIDLLVEAVKRFDHIGPDGIQVSLVQFNLEPYLEFSLRRHKCLDWLIEDIKDTEYMRGNTRLGAALDRVLKYGFTRARGDRENVPDVLVLVTDGSSEDKYDQAVAHARENGVKLIVVSTPSADPNKLIDLAGNLNNVILLGEQSTYSLGNELSSKMLSGTEIPVEDMTPYSNNLKENQHTTINPELTTKEEPPFIAPKNIYGEENIPVVDLSSPVDSEESTSSYQNTNEKESPPMDIGSVDILSMRCTQNGFKVYLDLPQEFEGVVFVKSYGDSAECRQDVISAQPRPIEMQIDAKSCGATQTSTDSIVESSVVLNIQHNMSIVTVEDRAFLLQCSKNADLPRPQLISADLTVLPHHVAIGQTVSLTTIPPTCTYSIREGSPNGSIVAHATLGQTIYHTWSCEGGFDANNVFGLIVHDCYASTDRDRRYPILDNIGCSSDLGVLGDPIYDEHQLLAYAESKAFGFEEAASMRFACNVSLCMRDGDGCEGVSPPRCSQSFDLNVARSTKKNSTAAEEALTSALGAQVSVAAPPSVVRGQFARLMASPMAWLLTAFTLLAILVTALFVRYASKPETSRQSSYDDVRPDVTADFEASTRRARMREFMQNFDRDRYV